MSKAMARCDHGKRSSQNRISSHSMKAAAIKKGHLDEKVVHPRCDEFSGAFVEDTVSALVLSLRTRPTVTAVEEEHL